MDDSFILSLSPHVATRIKENSESQKVELQASREHAKRECTLVVKDITSRLSTSDGHEFVEIWKSFDGVHSLKSSDVQYLTQRAKQSEEEQPDHSSRNNRAQHCELADSNSIQQTKLVEGDISRLTSFQGSAKATILTEYVAFLENS